MTPGLALLAPLLLAAGPAGHVEGSVRGEARVGASQSAGGAVEPSLDFEVDPTATLRLAWPSADVSVSYAPRLTLPTSGRALVRLLHQASLALEGRTEGGLRLSLREGASYGDAELSPVSQAGADPAVPIQPLPGGVTTIHYLSSQTTAGLDAPLGRRARLSLSAGWLVSGGIDRTAQRDIPLQRGPLAELSLEASASRIDTLRTRLYGSSALFTTGLRTTLAGVEEAWTRALARSWSLNLAAGAAAADVRVRDAASSDLRWFPVGEAGLAFTPLGQDRDLRGGLTLRASPIVDRLTGQAYERVDARLSASWAPRRELQLAARAGVGVVADGAQRGSTVAVADVVATWASGAEWALGVGARWAHQATPVSFDEFALFLDVAALARDRF